MRFVIVDDAHFLGTNGRRLINESLLHILLTAAAVAFFVVVFATAAMAFFMFAIAGLQMDEFAIDFARTAASIAFIGIDVHGKRVFGGNADNGVAKNRGASFSRINQNGNDFTILNAEIGGVFRSHMDMTLGNDDAFFEIHFSCRPTKGAFAGSFDVAGFTDRGS